MTHDGDSKPRPGSVCTIHPADEGAIARAGERLRSGALVAFPTETVYGLGADARNGEAVARIFQAKGRPRFNPLIVHVPDLAQAAGIGQISKQAERLALAFWPGPLTLVVERRAGCGLSDLVSAGLPTVAIRVPDHPVARALLRAADRPLAAPSANRSGHVSATRAEHVARDFAQHNLMIIDGGPTAFGLESTIVGVTGDNAVLLRSGAIETGVIEQVLGRSLLRSGEVGDRPNAPGQLASHYAPRAHLRLNVTEVRADEALLAFGAVVPASRGQIINLSLRANLIEAAANLFASLRALDDAGTGAIAVMPIPDEGLGEAINDRLRRAAAPRA